MREVSRAEHASTEQLSALLDGRAEPEELDFLAGHVERCVVCSHELADLRSVRDLLRALPVYLPSRSFTIAIEAARPPRRFRRLISLTRVLGALAAVLCVVLFSVDAMRTGFDGPMSVPNGASGAMHLTTSATLEAASDARPAAPRAARTASESEPPADAASKIANAPAAPAARPVQPAAAQQAPGAPAKPRAEAAPPAPQPTGAAIAPAALTPTAVPGQAAGGAAAPTPMASSWLSPTRLWSLAFALIAATLLIASLILSRLSRSGSEPSDEWSRP